MNRRNHDRTEDAEPPQGAPADFHVELLLETGETEQPPLSPWLADELVRLAALADVPAGGVTLAIVDDARMTELHECYHGDPSTTDVLSFDLRDEGAGDAGAPSPHPTPIEGDLVLCLDEARRQATQRGHDVRVELLLYALHGLLHLLGYDDHEPADAERMHRREDELLTRAGFGAVYGGEAGSHGPGSEKDQDR